MEGCPAERNLVAALAQDLPKAEEVEVETTDLYRHDEEQAYITLMSQEVKSLNFAAEENYTIRLCVRDQLPCALPHAPP